MKEIFNDILNQYFAKTAKDCYQILKSDNHISKTTQSRIGGIPYIPVGYDVPKDSAGSYMAFLMLINLKDIDIDGYPNNGVLELFLSLEWNTPQEFALLYFKDNLPARIDLPKAKCEDYEEYTWGTFAIRFAKVTDYMPTSDYRHEYIVNSLLKQYDFSDDDKQKAKEYVAEEIDKVILSKPKSTVCGYADFCQEDPRIQGDDKEECFIKIDALLDSKIINFGDNGIMSILCTKENIQNHEFEKMFCNIDCY